MQISATGVFLPLMQKRAMSNSCKMLLLLLLLPLQSRPATQASGNKTLASATSLETRLRRFKGRGGGVLRATHPRGLVVIRTDLDHGRVVRVEVEDDELRSCDQCARGDGV